MLWLLIRTLLKGSSLESIHLERWSCFQSFGWITVNYDGSVLGVGGKAAARGLLIDNNGRCLHAYAMNLGSCSITRAEMLLRELDVPGRKAIRK
ncbi:hypothetical protein LINPERHAP2_LOCUS21749 [Linum perenne]